MVNVFNSLKTSNCGVFSQESFLRPSGNCTALYVIKIVSLRDVMACVNNVLSDWYVLVNDCKQSLSMR
uniref:Uncharacterized protein n=1 Tax=Anguilla anguilla TaxID=7936 RepID=A0A0E9PI46_ANGAN